MPASNNSSQQNIMHKLVLMQEKQKTAEMQKLAKEQQTLAQQHQKKAQEAHKARQKAEEEASTYKDELHKLKLQFDPKYAWDYKENAKPIRKERTAAAKKTKAARRKRNPPTA